MNDRRSSLRFDWASSLTSVRAVAWSSGPCALVLGPPRNHVQWGGHRKM